jgi:hypothetical protein
LILKVLQRLACEKVVVFIPCSPVVLDADRLIALPTALLPQVNQVDIFAV